MPQTPYSPTNNDVGAVFTLAAAATGANMDLLNPMCRGVKVVVDLTASAGTSPTLTVTIRGKDTASGSYYTILASAALSSDGVTVLYVYPGATAVSNTAANDHIPQHWNLEYAIGGTTPTVTATIGVCYLV